VLAGEKRRELGGKKGKEGRAHLQLRRKTKRTTALIHTGTKGRRLPLVQRKSSMLSRGCKKRREVVGGETNELFFFEADHDSSLLPPPLPSSSSPRLTATRHFGFPNFPQRGEIPGPWLPELKVYTNKRRRQRLEADKRELPRASEKDASRSGTFASSLYRSRDAVWEIRGGRNLGNDEGRAAARRRLF